MTCDHSPTVRLHVAMLGGPEHCPSCLAARLAKAEALLREARDKLRELDGYSGANFVDLGIGIDGADALDRIDAFLNREKS